MKWCMLRYHHIFILILSSSFLSINAFPSLSKLVVKNGNNNSGILKNKQNPYPDGKNGDVSEDCFSTTEDFETSVPEEQKIEEKKRKMRLPEERKISAQRKPRKFNSRVKDSDEEQEITAKQETKTFSFGTPIIYPGTKWCGPKNIAKNDDDLGSEEEADKCCRTHDKCRDFIYPGETKYNLSNNSSFTSLSCECDDELYECLRKANTTTANSIGFLYFNLFGRKCFGLDYQKRCNNYKKFPNICSEFVVDALADKIYQWLPPKNFKSL